MHDDLIAKTVVNEAYSLHSELGPGLLESVYEALLAEALRSAGLQVTRQKPITITFRGKSIDEGFRADLLVEGRVLVELKSLAALAPVHVKQVLTYLRLANLRLGLLINFGDRYLKGNIERLVWDPNYRSKAGNRVPDNLILTPGFSNPPKP